MRASFFSSFTRIRTQCKLAKSSYSSSATANLWPYFSRTFYNVVLSLTGEELGQELVADLVDLLALVVAGAASVEGVELVLLLLSKRALRS